MSSNITGIHAETEIIPTTDIVLYGGYAQSKYICERIVSSMNGRIVRLGLLTGSTTTGKFPNNDFFSSFLSTLKRLRKAINHSEAFIDITPVDWAAQEILKTINNPKPFIHIANQRSCPLSLIVQTTSCEIISVEQFLKLIATEPKNIQILLQFAFLKKQSMIQFPYYFNIDCFQSTNHFYSVRNENPYDNYTLLKIYLSNDVQTT